MKESKKLEIILARYKLTSPLRYFLKRKILKSKRKTLVKIIKINGIDSAFVSAAAFFTDLFGRLGFRLSLAEGARAFAGAAVFCMLIIISSSLAVVYNYDRVSGYIIALIGIPDYQKGFIVGADENVKIVRYSRELSLKAKDRLITKDEIITGANGTIVFQLERKTQARMMPKSAGTVEIGLKAKSLFLRQGTVLFNILELAKDERFSVSAPNAIVIVTGTQFSVTYENERTMVTVLKGSVQVENLKSGKTTQIDEGKTAVIFENSIEMKDSEAAEKTILQKFGRLEYMNNILEKSESETNKFWEVVTALDMENEMGKEEDIKINTLEDIKKKYGKLEEVQLYNGRRYTGAIISRGGIYSLITVDGIKKIQAKDVKNVRIIK
jgi:hypothetical protein